MLGELCSVLERNAIGIKMEKALIVVPLTTQQKRHTVIGHMVNATSTSELRRLVRCFKSRLDLVSRLEEVS